MTEMSTMSESSQMSEASGMSTMDKPPEQGQSESAFGGGDDSGEGADKKEGDGFIIREAPPAAPTPFTRRRTTSEATTSPTPDQFQEPALTARPVPKPLATQHDDLVLCTITHRAQWDKTYPPDGLCDLLYYTSIRYDNSRYQFDGSYDRASFDLFLQKARAAGSGAKTGYGASFEYEYAQDAAAQVSRLSHLWNRGVRHFGILHAWDTASNLTSYNYKLNFIKEAKKTQTALGSGSTVHMALGFQVKKRSESSKTRNILSYIQKNYPVTILITVTHTIRAVKNDYSEGPTSWANSHVSYSLALIADEWRAAALNDTVWFMPSFTLAAVTWKLLNDYYSSHPDGSYQIRYWGPTIFEQACGGSGHEDKSGWYMYRGNWNSGQLLTWDYSYTLVKKMMNFFGRVGTAPKKHGIAVYDVDYDDPHAKCLKGAFFRLKMMNRYMRL
ncbi:uncharacterized protein LOC144132460 [Amblyomma americanum]